LSGGLQDEQGLKTMAKSMELVVEVRERTGKGGARAARREGMVPGILYGGKLAPVAITLRRNEVDKAIGTGQFLSSTVTINHKGDKQLVIPQAVQMHPVRDTPQHIDLYRVEADQKIKVEVQVHFVGEEESPGIKQGGSINIVRHTVELLVEAGNIPESLTADISELDIGDNVKISDIKLPAGAEPTITDRDFTVATIAGRTAEIVEEVEEEIVEGEEGEEGEEGAEGAEGEAGAEAGDGKGGDS
jgi:large subunit ribosomal protein L25